MSWTWRLTRLTEKKSLRAISFPACRARSRTSTLRGEALPQIPEVCKETSRADEGPAATLP